MDVFGTIKETLHIADVLALYGVNIHNCNKALCPLHNEKTPSFTIYPKSNSWHCFGCGAGGSAIDFVMAYFGLDSLDSAKKLDSDFCLGLFDEKEAPQEKTKKQTEQRAINQIYKGLSTAFDSYMDKTYSILCNYQNLLHDWRIKYAPRSTEETPNPLFLESCHKLEYVQYLVDSLLNADFNQQLEFYNTHRKEMLEIAGQVKRYTKSPSINKPA